jgi:hypothetical protein
MTLAKHPERTCLYAEGQACIDYKKDSESTIFPQLEKYKKDGYPEDNGLSANGIIVRVNNHEVRDFCNKWWEEVSNGSCRDQLSFNYALWKSPVVLTYIPFKKMYKYFKLHKHDKS